MAEDPRERDARLVWQANIMAQRYLLGALLAERFRQARDPAALLAAWHAAASRDLAAFGPAGLDPAEHAELARRTEALVHDLFAAAATTALETPRPSRRSSRRS